jgi:hypothetical protein
MVSVLETVLLDQRLYKMNFHVIINIKWLFPCFIPKTPECQEWIRNKSWMDPTTRMRLGSYRMLFIPSQFVPRTVLISYRTQKCPTYVYEGTSNATFMTVQRQFNSILNASCRQGYCGSPSWNEKCLTSSLCLTGQDWEAVVGVPCEHVDRRFPTTMRQYLQYARSCVAVQEHPAANPPANEEDDI